MLLLRACLYYSVMMVTLTLFSTFGLLIAPCPHHWRYAVISHWARFNIAALKTLCGVDWRVSGREHIPDGPAIIACKHQSAWETMALQSIFPIQVWVAKRELLWLPLFGWALATLRPIAIERGSGKQALQQIIDQGTQRLKEGVWVVIFPEGTRVGPHQSKRYGIGAGKLAEQSAYPIVPVAHNAGLFWSRNSFIKYPGTIDVVIGPVIDPKGKDAIALTREMQAWIDGTSNRLVAEAEAAGRSR